MNKYFMLDNYKKAGTTLESFQEEAAVIDNGTEKKMVHPDSVTALYCYKQKYLSGHIFSECQVLYDSCVYPNEEGGFERLEKLELHTDTTKITKNQLTLMKELKDNFIVNFDMNYTESSSNYFISDVAIKSLASKISVRTGLLNKDPYLRALLVTAGLADIEECSIVYRTDGKYNKIIAFVGNTYSRTPLYWVAKLAEAAEKYFTFDKWSIENNKTHVDLRYKDYIIRIKTSDTCEFADSVDVYLSKNIEYKLLSVPIDSVGNGVEYFEKLKTKLDKAGDVLKSVVTLESITPVIKNALGQKTSKFVLALLENKEDVYEALFEFDDVIKMSNNQLNEYSKILYHLVGDKLCA